MRASHVPMMDEAPAVAADTVLAAVVAVSLTKAAIDLSVRVGE